jgi:hypothetical protein
LVATVFSADACFEETRADREQGVELVTMSEQVLTTQHFAARRYDFVDTLHFDLAQAQGHAELSQIAVRTGDFDADGIHVCQLSFVLIQVNFLKRSHNYYGAQI